MISITSLALTDSQPLIRLRYFQAALRALGFDYTDEKEIAKILKIADHDHDGDVSVKEVANRTMHLQPTQYDAFL